MADLARLSDDELRQLYAQAAKRGVSVDQGAKPRSIQDLSDDELRAAAAGQQPAGLVDNVSRALWNGVTLGYGDEVSAGLNSTLRYVMPDAVESAVMDKGARTYDARLAQERAANTKLADDHPFINAAGQIVGGAVPGLATAGLGGGASLLGSAARLAGIGAAEGGVAGFGQGEGGAYNRLQSGAQGAAIGGAVGAAAPVIGAGATQVFNRLRPLWNPEAAAAGKIGSIITEGGGDVGDAAVRVASNAEPTALPLDDLGRVGQRRAEYVVAKNPRAAETIETALESRQGGAYGRLTDAVQAASGSPLSAAEFTRRSQDALRRYGAGPFDAAVRMPVDQTAAQAAWDSAMQSPALNRIANSDNYLMSLGEDFPGRLLKDIPLMDRLHRLQWFAREAGENMANPLNPGGRSNYMAGQIGGRREALNQDIGSFNPAFTRAQGKYADIASVPDAIKSASQFRSIKAEDLAQQWGGLSNREKAAYRVGAASELRSWLGSRQGQFVNYGAPLGTPEMTAKLQTVFGPDLEYIARREAEYARLYNDTTRQSPTARRLMAADDDDGPSLAGGAAFDLATGSPFLGTITQLARRGLKGLGDVGRGRQMQAEASAYVNGRDFIRLMQRYQRERALAETVDMGGRTVAPSLGITFGSYAARPDERRRR